jgi:hypothetical protein
VTVKTTYAGSHRARAHLGNHHDPASYKRAPFVPP